MEHIINTITEPTTLPGHDMLRAEAVHLAASVMFLHSHVYPDDLRLLKVVTEATLYCSGERTDETLGILAEIAEDTAMDAARYIPSGGQDHRGIAALFAAKAVQACCAPVVSLFEVQEHARKALEHDLLATAGQRLVH